MHEFTRELGARRRVQQTRGKYARRRSPTLRDSAYRPDASRRRVSLEETSARPETVFLGLLAKRRAEHVLMDATR